MAEIPGVTVPITIHLQSTDDGSLHEIFAPRAQVAYGSGEKAAALRRPSPDEIFRSVRTHLDAIPRARRALREKLDGIRSLFGRELAFALEAAIEEFEEHVSEANHYQETHRAAVTDQHIATVFEYDVKISKWAIENERLRSLLRRAVVAEDVRYESTRADRRKPKPEWYAAAVAELEGPF